MTGLYTLSGVDMYTEYGFAPMPGTSDSILSSRKPKEREFVDWPESGKEFNLLSPPVYELRTIPMKGRIMANNEADFIIKYNKLKSAFNVTGYLYLLCKQIENVQSAIKVFLNSDIKVVRLTRMKGGARVIVDIEFTLQEVDQ